MTEETTPQSDDDARDDFALDAEVVSGVRAAIADEDRARILSLVQSLHIADLADLIEQIERQERRSFLDLVWSDIDQEVLVELEEGVRDDVLGHLEPERLAEAARELETDEVVYLIEDLDDAAQAEVLAALDPAERSAVTKALTYPEYSAGRLMQSDFVRAPSFWTVGQMIDWLRGEEDLPDEFYDVIVLDEAGKPAGSIPLGRLLGTRRPVTLGTIMEGEVRTLHVEDRQEDVAYAFNQYHLVSAPVVDDDGRVVGVITIDDAMEVLEDEAEEDLRRLGGVGDEELSDSVREITFARFPWLAVNLLTAVLASAVISLFDTTIEAIVALAVLMPIVASMGGNAGTQSLTVAVRALATRDLTTANAARVVGREVAAGFANGIAFAIIIGGLTWGWSSDPLLGGVIAAAMVVNMVVAGLAGILIPMGLEKLGADPALASGTFVTTVTDVVGFFAFLGLAAAVLL